jgi:hypothetical protein
MQLGAIIQPAEALALKAKAARSARTPKPGGLAARFS